jgi:eukaryotic-like serine/threonine-protein kinase
MTVSEDTPPVHHHDLERFSRDLCESFLGAQIGRYLLVDKLAQGVFGVIFRARDVELDREVALKILAPDHANRFLHEATATARVVHPNVITILDCGQSDGVGYIAMDLLDGESLTDRLENCGRLLAHDAVEITRQLAAALEATHAAGILHRDLEPDNIFIVNDPAMPDGLRVKVLDVGLAKVLSPPS